MTPHTTLWIAGAIAAIAAAGFALTLRLPLPFDGFSALATAGLAFFGTLALIAWAPARWVWTDSETIRMAFQARHGLTDAGAEIALEAITTAHARADTLRQAARVMRDDMAEKITGVADRLDTAAREIFYVPDRRRDLRTVLLRAELIVEAATAHAKLRGRNQTATEDQSRAKLTSAVDALDAAFDETDLLAARGLLQEVGVASDVAERLLTPRNARAKPSS